MTSLNFPSLNSVGGTDRDDSGSGVVIRNNDALSSFSFDDVIIVGNVDVNIPKSAASGFNVTNMGNVACGTGHGYDNQFSVVVDGKTITKEDARKALEAAGIDCLTFAPTLNPTVTTEKPTTSPTPRPDPSTTPYPTVEQTRRVTKYPTSSAPGAFFTSSLVAAVSVAAALSAVSATSY